MPDLLLGQGPNVMMGLCDHGQVVEGTRLYFDNLFMSIKLLLSLSDRGMSQTRLQAVPIPDKKEIETKD